MTNGEYEYSELIGYYRRRIKDCDEYHYKNLKRIKELVEDIENLEYEKAVYERLLEKLISLNENGENKTQVIEKLKDLSK